MHRNVNDWATLPADFPWLGDCYGPVWSCTGVPSASGRRLLYHSYEMNETLIYGYAHTNGLLGSKPPHQTQNLRISLCPLVTLDVIQELIDPKRFLALAARFK